MTLDTDGPESVSEEALLEHLRQNPDQVKSFDEIVNLLHVVRIAYMFTQNFNSLKTGNDILQDYCLEIQDYCLILFFFCVCFCLKLSVPADFPGKTSSTLGYVESFPYSVSFLKHLIIEAQTSASIGKSAISFHNFHI